MRETIKHLERTFTEICTSSYPLEWDENHISFQLMKKLRDIFSNKIIHFNGWSKIVSWQSFKNRGKQENAYGDIALLVNIQFTSGEILKGVACIEAKRDYNSGNFESMDAEQLSRVCSNAPYSHLLLYLHRSYEQPLKFPNESEWTSTMWVSPINTAQELIFQTKLQENKRVLRTSFPFTMFLTSRIFWGLDLDYRQEVITDIEKGLGNIINPSFLGVVNVYYEHQNPFEINLSGLWQNI